MMLEVRVKGRGLLGLPRKAIAASSNITSSVRAVLDLCPHLELAVPSLQCVFLNDPFQAVS